MKVLREAKARASIRVKERMSIAGSFNPFTTDIYQERLQTPHEEMIECVNAYNTDSFFQSAINTMTDFIMGGGIIVKGEDEYSRKRVEEWLLNLKTNFWLRECIENTIKTGNGYAEIDFNPVTGLPGKVYPIADSSRMYINCDVYGEPLMTKKTIQLGNGEIGYKEIPNLREYFIQKIEYTQKDPKLNAKWYKLSYAVGGFLQIFTVYGIPIDARKIVHFRLNIGDTGLYGRSYMASALNDHLSMQQMEKSIAVIAKHKAVPRKIISVYDPNNPGDTGEIDELIMYMESFDQEDDIIINKPFNMQEFAYSGGEINLDYALTHVKKKIIAGVAPDFLMGLGDQVNRATAQVELLSYILSIYTKRKRFLDVVQERFIQPFIQRENLKDCKVDFGELNFEGVGEKQGRIMTLWQSNVITLGQTLEMLELPFEGTEKDITNQRNLEYQNAHMPDMFGGGVFGGDVGNEAEDPFLSPDSEITPNDDESVSFEDVTTGNSGATVTIDYPKKKKVEPMQEVINVPIEEGDTILTGKFRNKKVVVKDISENERGEPLVNGKPILNVRLTPKELQEDYEGIDTAELQRGIEVELEHTSNPEKAKTIAMTHLKEDPQYYTKLKRAGIESLMMHKYEDIKPPENYELDNDYDYDGYLTRSLEHKYHEQVEPKNGISFSKNPTGTKMLSAKFAIAIRRSFRNSYNKILNYIDANKQQITRSVLAEATLSPDIVTTILNTLGIAVNDLAPLIELYTGLIWNKANKYIAQQLKTGTSVPFNKRIVQAMANNHFGWVKKYGIEKEEQLKKALTESISQGDSITEIRQEVKNILKTTAWKSELIARTESVRIHNVSAMEAMKRSGVVENVRFVTAHDDRTCKFCRPLNNQVWPINSKQVKMPPIHPQCRCSTAPAMRSKDYYKDLRDKDKKFMQGEAEYEK